MSAIHSDSDTAMLCDTLQDGPTPSLSGLIMGRGAHFRDRLRASQVKAAQPTDKEQRIADGAGLYLVVATIAKGGQKRWNFRATLKDLSGGRGQLLSWGFGSVADVSLADARERATLYRRLCNEGTDPRAVKIGRDRDGRLAVLDWHPDQPQPSSRSNPTFRQAFTEFADYRCEQLTSEKFAKQWRRDVERFCFDVMGDMPVARIESSHVMAALQPIWHSRADTARKVAQRLAAFFDYAVGQKWYRGENPVTIARASLGKQTDRVKHRPALPWAKLPAFYSTIEDWNVDSSTQLAMRCLILTGARSKEIREATYAEIDLKQKIWLRPADHMKAKRPHAIPLTPAVIDIIAEARRRTPDSDLIFPGRSGRPMSDATLQTAVKRHHGQGEITAHGFRSSFRDWVTDNGHNGEAAEHQLAHVVGGKVQRAYARSDMMEQRRKMMREWERFVLAQPSS